MNKKEFINKLEKSINRLPKEEIKDIIFDYEEHFSMGLKNGKHEEEISKMLGDPKLIGKNYTMDFLFENAKSSKSIMLLIQAILSALGLLFLNLFLIIWIYIVLFVAVLSIWIVVLSLFITGLGGFFIPLIHQIMPENILIFGNLSYMIIFFLSIGIIAFSMLLGIGIGYITKWFIKLTIRYAQININIVRRQGGNIK